YEAVRLAKQSGKVRKGTNETTKAIERGTSKLVVIAEDVEPPEVVAHLPILCEDRNAAYIFVPSKQQLGASLGIDVGSAAATIMEAGEAQHIVDQVISSIATVKGKKE
ncbi:MAG: 50S ribosomal protein L7Ae, partial [Nitrososphaeraceae archaeon]